MKKKLILLICAVLMVTAIGCSSVITSNNNGNSNNTKYKDGIYAAAGQGKSGEVKVEVKIAKGKFTEINIIDNKETPAMMDAVKENLIPDIIKKQTTEGVDTLSGATLASKAVLEAVGKVQKDASK